MLMFNMISVKKNVIGNFCRWLNNWLRLCFPNGLFFFRFPHQNPACFPLLPSKPHESCSSHCTSLYSSSDLRWAESLDALCFSRLSPPPAQSQISFSAPYSRKLSGFALSLIQEFVFHIMHKRDTVIHCTCVSVWVFVCVWVCVLDGSRLLPVL
jgi:hypothetical protein